MTREEAIAIIRKEYLCVDRDCDIDRSCGKCDLMMPSKEPILEAYKIAIKALEQEPCEDAIDRKLVCAFIAGLISDDVERKKALEYINELPPVNPIEPCEDAIDRAKAIKIASGYCHPANVAKELAKLPAVNPTKTGHWIKSRDCYGNHHFTCSECGNDIATQNADNWDDKYCFECGARMVEPQERSDKE